MQRQTIATKAGVMTACLFIASIASIPVRADTIGIAYSFVGGPVAPPIQNGTTLILEGLDTGSVTQWNPAVNALWNPVTFHDNSVVDLTTGLLSGSFSMTFANGDMLSGNLFEDVSAVVATGTGPFTQKLTFTGGTGKFAGATGSTSGGGFAGTSGSSSGSGTLTAAGVSAPEPASIALAGFGVTAILVWTRRRRRAN
jgi:uncharacterized membrane protein YgcG